MKTIYKGAGFLAGILGSLFWMAPVYASVSQIRIEVEEVIRRTAGARYYTGKLGL